MIRPKITEGEWKAAFFAVIDSRACRIASIEEMPSQDRTEQASNARFLAASKQMASVLENWFAYTTSHPENREVQTLHLQTMAALIAAGYEIP